MSTAPEIQLADDLPGVSRLAADAFVRFVQEPIVTRGRATVALAGGATPQRFYELLGSPPHSTRLDFSAIRFYFGDERCVPPDHEQSNYRMARAALLDSAGVPEENIVRIRGELGPAVAADDYEKTLREHFAGGWPRFDLVLLGLADDGHTASLFPGGAELDVAERWVTASRAPSGVPERVTLTVEAINHARHIMFLVAGESKSAIVARVFDGDESLPATRIRPAGGLLRWVLDRAAAERLNLPRD
jgi:6-phosphogluconolactonase